MSWTTMHQAVLIRGGKILAFCAVILVTTKLTLEFGAITNSSTAAFFFLIIVLMSAFFGDLLVAIITSLVATLCFDYFYLPPVGTINISSFSDWISLFAFLLASVIISRLTASAAENKVKAYVLNKTMVQLKAFGENLLSIPKDQLTLSGIAQAALNSFSLEYCSIHVYGEGKWQHYSGKAFTGIFRMVEKKVDTLPHYPTDLMELADENMLGVQYMQIKKGTATQALLVVKSKTLAAETLGAIASMIGVQLSIIMKG